MFLWVAEAACRAGRRGWKKRGLGGGGRAGEAGRASPLRARVPRAILGASQGAQVVKGGPASAGDVRDAGLIPGSGRPPGGGNGNPRWYSRLGNPMDRGAGGLQSVGHREPDTAGRLSMHVRTLEV